MSSKYANIHLNSEPHIDNANLNSSKNMNAVDATKSTEPKNGGAFSFTRLKDQNVTGFTHGSIETGPLGSKQSTTLEHKKASVLPDISLVQSFYQPN